MNNFNLLKWLVPFIKLRTTKTNLPARSTVVLSPSPSVTEIQSVGEDAGVEDPSDDLTGEQEVSEDEQDAMETSIVSSRKLGYVSSNKEGKVDEKET